MGKVFLSFIAKGLIFRKRYLRRKFSPSRHIVVKAKKKTFLCCTELFIFFLNHENIEKFVYVKKKNVSYT